MINYIIIFPSDGSIEEVKKFSIKYGGELIEEYDRVSIKNENGHIYIDFYYDLNDFEENELSVISKVLGTTPKNCICVNIGHSEGALSLAKDFARKVQGQFQSVVWDDQDVFDEEDSKDLKVIKY